MSTASTAPRGRATVRALAALLVVAAAVMLWFGTRTTGPAEATPVTNATVALNSDGSPKHEPIGATSAAVTLDSDTGTSGQTDERSVMMTPKQMAPNRLFIPSLGVYARTAAAGLDAHENLILPTNLRVVSFYTGAATLSDTSGSVLIAGHVHWGNSWGVLGNLGTIPLNSLVYVTDEAGKVTTWQVVSRRSYVKAALPERVWQKTGNHRLTLITCGGTIYQSGGRWHYPDNVVVEAVRLS